MVKQKSAAPAIALAYVGGFITSFVVMLTAAEAIHRKIEKEKKLGPELEPGVYLNSRPTSDIIYAIGLHALKDEIYDEYEIEDMISEVNTVN